MEDNTVAKTIIEQLGGIGILRAMLGVKSVRRTDNGIAFRFKGNRKMNYASIDLTCLDLYDIGFYRVTVKGVKEVSTTTSVYGEDLQKCFEKTTGLRLAIPRIIGVNA